MEEPKLPSEARKRRSAEGGGELGSPPPQHGGQGAMAPENFSKSNVEIAYFSTFLRAEMVSSACSGIDYVTFDKRQLRNPPKNSHDYYVNLMVTT